MGVGMIADLMAGCNHLARYAGQPADIGAALKKRCVHAQTVEEFE